MWYYLKVRTILSNACAPGKNNYQEILTKEGIIYEGKWRSININNWMAQAYIDKKAFVGAWNESKTTTKLSDS